MNTKKRNAAETTKKILEKAANAKEQRIINKTPNLKNGWFWHGIMLNKAGKEVSFRTFLLKETRGYKIYRTIAGRVIPEFVPRRNKKMLAQGPGGSMGTFSLKVVEFPHEITGEVLREVPKGYWGKGVGSAYLVAAEELARKIGIDRIFATTRRDNEAAVRGYHKAGWEFVRKLPGEKVKFQKVLKH